jgi:integrase
MSRRPKVPSYRLHKQSGQAVVTLTDHLGTRRDVLLGKHGTPESRAEYARVLAEWETSGRRLPAKSAEVSAPASLSVNELMLAYLHHADGYYVADGRPTSQPDRIRQALRPVKELYGHIPASAFGPLALKAVREKLVARGYARTHVNQLVGCIKRMFQWAVAEEVVPSSVFHGLQAVAGLKKGRTTAYEPEPVAPVALAVVEETRPHLSRTIAAMVQVELLTGMRPGEVCLLRGCDLEMSGPVWIYRPARHKTAHHGHQRAVAIGPKAQEVLRPFLKTDLLAYLFSPAEAEAQRQAARRAARKSKVQPSQVSRKKKRPKRAPGAHYTPHSYHQALRKAILAANTAAACADCKPKKPAERCDACKADALPHWHPHQLRHTHATEVRRRFGLEAAQVALGHASADVTQVYAERNLTLAVQVAAQIG